MNLSVRDARADETALLVRIAVESGTYTGHSNGGQPARGILTGRDDVLWQHPLSTRIACVGGQVCGFAQLLTAGAGVADLSLLFIHHDRRGQGIGRFLLEDVHRVALELGIARTRIVAHPPAEGFFLRLGARRTHTRPPTGDVGWFCPVLELTATSGSIGTGDRAPAMVGR